MLAGPNGARGRIRTCTGDALDVVSLLLDYASEMDGASCRCCPGLTFLQRKPAGCRKEAKWSQSPVLLWAQRAYETRLSAGSTAMFSKNQQNGAPTRSCTGLKLAYRASASLTMLWGRSQVKNEERGVQSGRHQCSSEFCILTSAFCIHICWVCYSP